MNPGERILVSRHSAFQPILLTEDEAGMRILRFGSEGASQSIVKADNPRHLALPYARLLPACLAFAQSLQRVLVVGLGGGSLPRFFHSHFPEMTIDAVEIDRDVVEVAREYCGFTEDARMRAYVEDGRDFIESRRGLYDVIVLDSFDTDSIPPHLATLEFLHGVRRALTPEGMVVANVWGRSVNPAYGHMLLTYRAAFEDVYVFDVPLRHARLFVGLQQRQEMTRQQLMLKADTLSRQRHFAYSLIDSIAGFRHSDHETIRGGTILRD